MEINSFDTRYISDPISAVPMYFASSFKWMIERVPDHLILPTMKVALERVPPVGFDLGAVCGPGVDVLPDYLSSEFRRRLSERCRFHSAEEIDSIAVWDARR